MPGAKPRSEHFVDRPVYDLAIRTWLSDFLDRWLAPKERAERALTA
jgi:GMP synthase (glutamine-hydrolysing)